MKPALILAVTLAGCQAKTPEFAFTDVSITLPDEDPVFPPGPGVEAVTDNCAACHSPSMILTQPRLTPEQWRATIDKMKAAYKAPVDPAAEPAILAYLTATSAAQLK